MISIVILLIAIVLAAACGLYGGVWCMMIKPIIDVAIAIDAGMLTATMIGWAVVKFFVLGPILCSIAWLIFWTGTVICAGLNS